MASYLVGITVEYEIEVEADDQIEAENKAFEQYGTWGSVVSEQSDYVIEIEN